MLRRVDSRGHAPRSALACRLGGMAAVAGLDGRLLVDEKLRAVAADHPRPRPLATTRQRRDTRFRSIFAYIAATLDDGPPMPLMRLRYGGSANRWGFAIYLGSTGKYQDSILSSGVFTGTTEEALDCACGLYLTDPTAWLQPATN